MATGFARAVVLLAERAAGVEVAPCERRELLLARG